MSDCAEFHDMTQLKAIFDGMPHIVTLVNDQVGIDMINKKGAALTGRENDTISGQLCGDVFRCLNAVDEQVCGLQPECRLCPLRTKIMATFQTGIPEEIMPRIFDMFFSTKNSDQGTGLGLAVVADIVHEYDGDITVTSIPGEKTTFTVYLPVKN
jgi:PAS domain-containing protein